MGLNWHFPRHDLTERFLSTFGSGVSNTLTLFAPRRMGKTEFVLYDLIPTAHDHGYLCIYVSFWENPENPCPMPPGRPRPGYIRAQLVPAEMAPSWDTGGI